MKPALQFLLIYVSSVAIGVLAVYLGVHWAVS